MRMISMALFAATIMLMAVIVFASFSTAFFDGGPCSPEPFDGCE